MKVILYTGVSINGFIAKQDGNTDWISQNEFNTTCQKIKSVVLGRKTWDEMNPKYLPFPEGRGLYIVLTHNLSLRSSNPKTIFTDRSPSEILQLAQDQGYPEVLIAGGSQTYGYFLKSGLVDEIYVDIEPYIFGQGIKFFPDSDFELNLKLLETKKISDQTIQLHYKVIK